ncbi:MAG: saccharopine dehydrogenase NADP-binding domain-containing protein [Myxococcales bacterium]|nr:saccharopine dehydrogenase NADP-binding domain-containing protein [Myxococcales bacterium]
MPEHDGPEREFDVVVYGATGFTGQLVVEYLATRAAEARPLRWALAGRNADKLAAVRDRLASAEPRGEAPALITATSDDRAALDAMARRARVVLTTVGPYARYGEPLVAACVEAGTDCVDLTGEPDWWREMIARYHDRAITTGAKIVSCCGFDSIPHDLGALFTAMELAIQPGERAVVRSYVQARGGFSGGTWQSLVGALANLRRARTRGTGDAGARREDRRDRGIHNAREAGGWVVPLPTIDPLVVRRSAALSESGVFGDDFRYHPYLVVKRLSGVVGLLGGVGLLAALAQLGPTRRLLERVRRPGEGPPPEQRAKNWFRVEHHGECAGRRVVTRVTGGDPGYGETAKMIAEAALTLALDRDRLPARGGVLTTATAMGEPLIERLRAAGIGFERAR